MVHYRALRLAVGDYKRLRSRDTLNFECKRATPQQWASYITASTVIKILRSASPRVIKDRLMKTICTNARKQHRPHFFDLSIRKIGCQALFNWISSIFKCINFDWHNLNLDNERIRVELKRTFFPLYQSDKHY